MSDTRNILVVEDDPSIALGLSDTLNFEGFSVTQCSTGDEALKKIQSDAPDCMILDLMLPDFNGYKICEIVRDAGHKFPIIILSARGQEADKIRGLDAGADDYVTKPFSLGELVARVRAIFRRTTQGSARSEDTFPIGSMTVNTRTQVIATAKDAVIHLSFYETELLKLLYSAEGQPVSREEILAKIWGMEGSSANRSVDNFIVKLRKKIEADPNRPQHILTVYGQGYKLVC